jgi:superfamily II DNA or RNA helicase
LKGAIIERSNMTDRIKVIESPCGTGKTSWAIEYINSLPEDKKVLYITPFLAECQRVKNSTNKNMIEPVADFKTRNKKNHLLMLLKNEENIVSTHSLFAKIDDEIVSALRASNYILILDEAFQVLNKFDMWGELSKTSEDTKEK